jgi:hypothetical protein
VELDNVPYGANGSWAINLWMRAQSLQGDLFEYVYSHNSTAPDPSGWGPNQVPCLLCAAMNKARVPAACPADEDDHDM